MVCTNKLSPGYHVVETNLPARPRREYLVIKMNIPMASSLPFWELTSAFMSVRL